MKLVIIYISLLFVYGCRSGELETQPRLKQLTEAVYASGTLVPENEYTVKSSVDGFLTHIRVVDGDSVRKGMLLFTVSNENIEASVATASRLLIKTRSVAEINSPAVKDLQHRLSVAITKFKNDSLQRLRYNNLYAQDAISKSQHEKYSLQYESSLNEVASIQQQVQQVRLNAGVQLQQAANLVTVARSQRSSGIIKSFTDGIVYAVYSKQGEMIYPNQSIALIGSGRMIAKLSVDEDDLGKIVTGQKVQVTLDAYPDSVFTATIGRIYPLLNKVEQSFRVDAWFDTPLAVPLYGLNVEANIIIREQVSSLVIPRKALRKGDSVKLKEERSVKMVKVQTGIEDKDWVEVTGGIISSSQTIILQ